MVYQTLWWYNLSFVILILPTFFFENLLKKEKLFRSRFRNFASNINVRIMCEQKELFKILKIQTLKSFFSIKTNFFCWNVQFSYFIVKFKVHTHFREERELFKILDKNTANIIVADVKN